MRLAFVNSEGALELRWMWMPAFISQNYGLMKELQEAWKKAYPVGVAAATAEDDAHYFVIEWLYNKLKIEGLSNYLSAIKFVKEG